MPSFDPKTEYDITPRSIPIKDFHDYSEEFVVRPPYQRKSVWTRKKQQALLDSLFRRYYIPRLVIREVRLSDDRTVKEVIDGQQRITTVQNFFDNKLSLPKTLADLNKSLPGKYYGDLETDVRRFVDRLSYDADIVKQIDEPDNPKHQEIATEIFWRLQQGESLNYMEVAHSRLSSLARNFVVKYADDQRFDYANYKPADDNPDKHSFFDVIDRNNNRMQHLALLTRFLIIEEEDGPADIKDTVVVEYIDKYKTEDGIANWSMEKSPHAQRTLSNMRAFYDIFSDDPMVSANGGLKEFKIEYFIVSMYMLLRHLRANYVFDSAEKALFKQFTIDFHSRWRGGRKEVDTDILIFSDKRQQSAQEIEVRDRILRQAFFNYARENGHAILTKDERRAFNEAERIQIYRAADGLCAICLEEGKPDSEAVVPWSEYQADHVIPHSRGGQTVLDNAQLLCRYHNQQKGARV